MLSSQQSESHVEPSRSSQHYYDGRSVVLQVGRTLYKLPASLLRRRSSVFNDLFDLPPTQDPEGCSDETPIVLQGVTEADFDHLMTFLWGSNPEQKPPTLPYLIAVLKLSDLWDIQDGREYAIPQLELQRDFNNFLKLSCAVKYHVDHWVADSFRSLLLLDLDEYQPGQIDELGLRVYTALSFVRFKLDKFRRSLSYGDPPFSQSVACMTPKRCQAAWLSIWNDRFAKMLIHPDVPTGAASVLIAIGDVIGEVEGLCALCHNASWQDLTDTGVSLREEAIIQAGIDGLRGL
ncbi:hypothetical protein BV25DRAFT_1833563 [Artomyces pyxidatus]|uniref:Uncharacterized protein n=1 Tax=Artomyces pyxidatus TaxID=48021 RepID=A0ACB8SG25_9AGAM|nr:hypothetical protein BV25DRAFT_1833563 [Artomyces pyxidatus]